MTIAIDMDGVLSRFEEAFGRALLGLYPDAKRLPCPNWDTVGWDITPEQVDAVWAVIKATENFWLTLSPYSDSIQSLKTFLRKHSGLDICFLTSRVKTAGQSVSIQTEEWLRQQGISTEAYPQHVLYVVRRSANSKAKWLAKNDAWYMIDDKAETVEQINNTVATCIPYLLKRPWNEHAWDKVLTVNNLGDFFKIVA